MSKLHFKFFIQNKVSPKIMYHSEINTIWFLKIYLGFSGNLKILLNSMKVFKVMILINLSQFFGEFKNSIKFNEIFKSKDIFLIIG